MSATHDSGGRTRTLALIALAGFVVMVAAFIPSPLRVLTYFEGVPEPEIEAPPPLKMATLPPKDSFAEITFRSSRSWVSSPTGSCSWPWYRRPAARQRVSAPAIRSRVGGSRRSMYQA
jgi:hypothetical protein